MAQRVGIDLTSVDAVRQAVEEHGDGYLERVYTAQEREDCKSDPTRLAARFAAKEAAIKVLRPTVSTSLPWTDIEVVRQAGGHVELLLTGLAAASAAAQGLQGFAVSLTHEGSFACAVVIAHNGPEGKAQTCR
jgi:holo-[acyl-carrier protein] synthase